MLCNFKIMLTLSLIPFLSGCATIAGNSMQPLTIDARDKNNQPISGVHCKVVNDKGSWSTITPGSVMVQKSASDLHIVAEKVGCEPGTARVISKAGAGMFGNIILGGGVGAIIDHSKGTAYNYPSTVTVIMGENLVLPERIKNKRKILKSENSVKNIEKQR